METSKPWSPSQLAEELEKMKGMKLPDKTLFGDLNFLVPKPQNKHFDGMNNFPVRAPQEGQ